MLTLGLSLLFLGAPALPATVAPQAALIQPAAQQALNSAPEASSKEPVGDWKCKAEGKVENVRFWMDGNSTYRRGGSGYGKYSVGIGPAAWEFKGDSSWRMKDGKICEKMTSCASRALNEAARTLEKEAGGNPFCGAEAYKETCLFIAVTATTMEQHLTKPPMTLKCKRR